MSRLAIKVEKLGKRYRLGRREQYKALRDVLTGSLVASFRRWSNGQAGSQNPDSHTIWALNAISFEVKQGEVLGVIGPNGVGKTTLLKILSRITEPTEGYAEIHGRVGSLLEVGTGFHPELTGRENIYLNGAILGMRRNEIASKFDEIVEFSGVERFIDTPVKHYSSGMYVRLAFAVAAHLDPEILLVDEVLAVGDAAFQGKCLGKMGQVASSGRTVLFVSHNMAAVRNLCSRALLLKGGQVQYQGLPEDVIQRYLADVHSPTLCGPVDLAQRKDRVGNGNIRVVSFEALSYDGDRVAPRTGSTAEFIIGYEASENKPLRWLYVIITVADIYGTNLFSCAPVRRNFRNLPPMGKIACTIKALPLIPGVYTVNIALKDEFGFADQLLNAAHFSVIDAGSRSDVYGSHLKYGSLIVGSDWAMVQEVEGVEAAHRESYPGA